MPKRKLIELLIDDEQEAWGVDAISLVQYPAIESNFVFFSKQDKSSVVSLAAIDEDKRTVIGPALIPDKHIPRYDEFSAEEYDVYFSKDTVKLASELFLSNNHIHSHTFEHQVPVEGVSVVESWIVDDPAVDKSAVYNLSVPAGTWMVRLKVNNEEVWQEIKAGTVRGLSIEGYFLDRVTNMSNTLLKSPESDMVQKLKTAFLNMFKSKFYKEMVISNGDVFVTDSDAIQAGTAVSKLDDDGLPTEIENGMYQTVDGLQFEVTDGVIVSLQTEEDEIIEEEEMNSIDYKALYNQALEKNKLNMGKAKKHKHSVELIYMIENALKALDNSMRDAHRVLDGLELCSNQLDDAMSETVEPIWDEVQSEIDEPYQIVNQAIQYLTEVFDAGEEAQQQLRKLLNATDVGY